MSQVNASVRFFILFSLLFFAYNCSDSPTKTKKSVKQEKKIIKKNSIGLDIRPFRIGSGWGYDIYNNNKRFIHQPHIPALRGNQHFKKKEDALAVGKAVIKKIEKGLIPPSLSKIEVDSILQL